MTAKRYVTGAAAKQSVWIVLLIARNVVSQCVLVVVRTAPTCHPSVFVVAVTNRFALIAKKAISARIAETR